MTGKMMQQQKGMKRMTQQEKNTELRMVKKTDDAEDVYPTEDAGNSDDRHNYDGEVAVGESDDSRNSSKDISPIDTIKENSAGDGKTGKVTVVKEK